jgi:hypothetical protein
MTRHQLVLWTARILSIGMIVLLGLLAMDAFEPGKALAPALADFAIHLLPAAGVLAILVCSWHRPWIGGVAFLLLAAAYAATARSRPDWILVVSGPLLVAGGLFLWSWRTATSRP